MTVSGLDQVAVVLRRTPRVRPAARVVAIKPEFVELAGSLPTLALGHQVEFLNRPERLCGEVVGIDGGIVTVVVEAAGHDLSIGDPAVHIGAFEIAADESWIGRVIDPRGVPLDGRPLPQGVEARQISSLPPPAATRRSFGPRLQTGLQALNTFLPVVQGQRLGLFAGAGVGKSNLIGSLASDLQADVVVVGLVGERGREVGAFVRQILGPAGMARSVVVAATSDQPALKRRRAALTAMTVAEHFRDAGHHVLLMIDSITRLAEAHREIASAAGEPTTMRGFPPSIVPLLASLAERAGPGADGQGDITALFSVLVAGSDMDEPVADTLRGLLDGHIVLSRSIAERGRFPAIDVLRSVSRSLPDSASAAENALLAKARARLSLYENSEIMIRSGLYQKGANSELDCAVESFPELDKFIATRSSTSVEESFATLAKILEDAETADGDAA